MNGLLWWIDRWRKSTAYRDMNSAQQGAYRNLLDEAWLRGGVLPDDPKLWRKVCGNPRNWSRICAAVMTHFERRNDGLHNATLDAVLSQVSRRNARQKAYRARNAGHNANHNGGHNGDVPLKLKATNPPVVPLSPSPKPRRRDVPGGSTCSHTPRCHSTAECVERSIRWDEL